MSYTKGELVRAALNEIGISEYEFDITAEELVTGVRRLDSMIAQWIAEGINLGYPMAGTADGSDSDDDSLLPDAAWEAVITNLAVRLAPSYGKTASPETRTTADKALKTLKKFALKPVKMQLRRMPKGAGYKTTERRFIPSPKDRYLRNVDNNVDISGEYYE